MQFSDNRADFKHLTVPLLIAVLARAALFFGSMVVPIPNEAGLPVSPLTANTALDLGYYQWARSMYFGDIDLVIETYVRFFAGNEKSHFFLPGPLFPGLLQLFDYGPANTVLLSGVYLLLGIGLSAAWLLWLWRQGIGPIWLYVFALLPTPFWFMLNVSTDLLFAVLVGGFWLYWFERGALRPRRMIGLSIVAVLSVLVRPNALSLLLFLLIDTLIWEFATREQGRARRRGLTFAALTGGLLLIFGLFYLPYLNWVLDGAKDAGYFGLPSSQYEAGLWPELPHLLNLAVSWLSLFGAKILYLTGLRPSFGDTLTPLVVLRMLPAFVMLPGLLWLLIRAEWRIRLFVVFFLAPILLGISQDRYVLPIQPILFFYGAKAWGEIAQLCARWRTNTG